MLAKDKKQYAIKATNENGEFDSIYKKRFNKPAISKTALTVSLMVAYFPHILGSESEARKIVDGLIWELDNNEKGHTVSVSFSYVKTENRFFGLINNIDRTILG